MNFFFCFAFLACGGLKLFIGRDGKASLGSHETQSRGAFKQSSLQNPR